MRVDNRKNCCLMSQREQYIAKWVGYLNDIDREMSRMAAQKLASAGDSSVVPALIKALDKRPDDVRIAAARALGDLGDNRAVKPLLGLLYDGNPLIASTAAEALGAIGDEAAVPDLVAILRDYKSGNSRHFQIHGFNRGLFMAAVHALERIGTREAQRAVKTYHR